MTTLEEKLAKAKEHVRELERQRRIRLRKEREEKKKQDQRRNYIVGELVCKYFPKLLELPPGTKAQNEQTFKELEVALSKLSQDGEFIRLLSEQESNLT